MKTIHIVITIFLVILLGAGAYFFIKNPSQTKTEENLNSLSESEEPSSFTQNSDSDEMSLSGNLIDILDLNKSVKCTYSTPEIEGTVYIFDKKARSDYEITMENQEKTTAHMIMDNNWVYTWSSNVAQGIKMELSDEDIKEAAEDVEENFEVDSLQEQYDYKCSDWNFDESYFKIPTEITFTELSETPSNTDFCSACNLAQTEEQKQECRVTFNCK